eukprot:4578766-Prorocentrum_lima.AAC.1
MCIRDSDTEVLWDVHRNIAPVVHNLGPLVALQACQAVDAILREVDATTNGVNLHLGMDELKPGA